MTPSARALGPRFWARLNAVGLALPAALVLAIPLTGLGAEILRSSPSLAWLEPVEVEAWWRLGQALLIAYALALPVGLATAVLIARPGKSVSPALWALLALPLAVPAFLHGTAWQELAFRLFPKDFLPKIFQAGIALAAARWPLITACTAAAIAQQSEDAALAVEVVGGPWRRRLMTLRRAQKGMAAGSLIFLIMTALDHVTPEFSGIRTTALVFFEAMQLFGEPLRALKAAAPMVVGLALAALALGWLCRKPIAQGGGGRGRVALSIGQWLCLVAILAASVGPTIVTLAWRSGNYGRLGREMGEPLAVGLGQAGLAALVAVTAALLAESSRRSAFPWPSRLTWGLGLLAFVLPGPLLAVGTLRSLAPLGLQKTPWPLILSLAAQGYWIAAELLRAATISLDPNTLDAARVAGAGPIRRAWLLARLLAPSAMVAGLLIAWMAFTDIAQSALLYAPRWQPYSVRLGNWLHYGGERLASAAALVGVLLDLAVLILLLCFIGRSRAKGPTPSCPRSRSKT